MHPVPLPRHIELMREDIEEEREEGGIRKREGI
jgi:hypothetical protein